MDRNSKEQALRLHECLDYIGLRAQATSVGLLQLCAELVAVGVLDDDAVDRIKDAIQHDITVSRPRKHGQMEFETVLRKRLDAVFPRVADPTIGIRVGTACDMKVAMGDVSPVTAPN
ncbi:hypothetical protein P1X14_12190 [Sphingomonas sp. AOB5]|uniref:hypothetical protein n=1 Tax=Sphingomonas sp. AOB5 TaxID=3034017 RepID=UPI0023F9683D|nr:hypothetical protein [Sphingomonas sp. AOB5]MDF7776009.1 hypothetical protein [Sphingomonas sp. AOB5]